MAASSSQTPYMDAMVRIGKAEDVRAAREAKMRNALEILAYIDASNPGSLRAFAQFVRATAREGLGRE